ncbi:MAG: hypothetical protein JRJ87_06695 [Deltaproteobacteria bacterium]|nr:hypothetical protein [Deltaproteobacteria bacterium]
MTDNLKRCLLALFLVASLSANVLADATIDVDGDLSDWPADAFTFYDENQDMPFFWRDILQIQMTNDNTSGSDGNLYLAIEFRGRFRENFGGIDIDIYINLDIDGDGQIGGPNDRVIELTEGTVTDGDGNPVGSVGEMDYSGVFLEASIPYSVLGLSHGSDVFGVSVVTTGVPGHTDYSPEPGEGDDGFIVYDGTTGDGGEPLAVRLLALAAATGNEGVTIHWATGSERGNAGFDVYHLDAKRNLTRLTKNPVPGLLNASLGQNYHFTDRDGRAGDSYLVEDIEVNGRRKKHGPIVARSYLQDPVFEVRLGRTKQPKKSSPTKIQSIFKLPVDTKNYSAAVKIAVAQEGLNRLTHDDLVAAGLDPVALQNEGLTLERKIGLVPVLEFNSEFWFVGQPEPDRYADFEVLKAATGAGRRMSTRKVDGSCRAEVRDVFDSIVIEKNLAYHIASPTNDPFFWALAFDGAPAELTFDLPRATSRWVSLRIHVAGTGPRHSISVVLNDLPVGRAIWNGRQMQQFTFKVKAAGLLEQGNLLAIGLLPGRAADVVFVDKIDFSYQRALEAGDQTLVFNASSGQCLRIDGIAEGELFLLDVSDPARPVNLTGYRTISSADNLSIQFQDKAIVPIGFSRTKPRRYLLATSAMFSVPDSRGAWQASDLMSEDLEVDYLVITHPDFRQAAERISAFHLSQGRRTLVASTEQIYTTFNHGRPSAQAIQDLLHTARTNWSVAPVFVLLLGGSTVDSNNYLGYSETDFVPAPFWVSSVSGFEAASDGWYVAAQDGLTPTAAIGRLAVRTSQAADQVVDKIIAWQTAPTLLTDRMLFIADRDQADQSEEDGIFEHLIGRLIEACLPDSIQAERLLVAQSEDPASELQAIIEKGVDSINYVGHAYLEGWSSPPIMTTQLAGLLANQQPFFLFSWSCFDGAFTGPWGDSLAWAFVQNPDGGALGALAASSLSDPRAVAELAELTLCLITSSEAETLGQAVARAKQTLLGIDQAHQDLISTFNLLGDPALPNPWINNP